MLTLAPFFFLSCGDDDDDKSSNNEISLGSETHKVTLVTITGTEMDGEGDYTIILTSTTSDPQKVLSVMLNVSFATANGVSGYYDIDNQDYLLGAISSGYLYTSIKEEQPEDMDTYFNLTEGTCSIKHNKNKNYTITFDIKPANGERIKGSYTGDVMGNIIKI
ncbi:hypothetical protein LJC28_02960 [Dysgonomonas sp. OttesenSCG-928-D17]|nr:hypothetical protein [Dysgonomonas sp. OttesenSCG-928-D17]